MLRSLIRLYLIVLLGGGLAIAFINHYFVQFFHDRVTESQRENIRVDAFLLADYLERHPGAQRAAALAELQKIGGAGFSILTMKDMASLVNRDTLRDLRDGKLVLSADGKDYYLPLP